MSFEFITQQLKQQHQQARFRQRVCHDGEVGQSNGREIVVDGKSYLNFSSNDYLGLNNHPLINKALQEGIDRFGLSASASSLVTGFSYAHQTLENEICQWLNKPRCLLFSSGFSANLGILQALGQSSANIWLDKLSHASLIDGALSSKATVKRFKHNDINHLNTLISSIKQKTNTDNGLHEPILKTRDNIIVSEGVFSMDGDLAPIEQLSSLSNRYDGKLFIDDAHSIGVIGKNGQGSSSLANIDIVMATFGKAIASSGAFVVCQEDVFEYLTNFSKHYIYSTAISPALAWATNQSIKIIQTEHWRREKITELSEQFNQLLSPGIDLIPTQSSIHGLVVGGEEKTLLASKKLKERGLWVTAIRPPTVPLNSSRLRVTICSNHNANDIRYLAKNINEVLS
ncbi:MAG: 8-amino-7-oxononanoate synthase [Colwellia sp.]|nr:8-amino-7-oxononanoate synthase [Colwellia sp.]